MKACGVAVAMLQEHSWAPTLSNGWTIPPVPSPASSHLAGGKARCRLMPAGWGGGPVVVRGRESRWAVENARGLGCHLAHWLVAQEETVLDASTAATARVRELSRGGPRKNDVMDTAAAASVAALQGDASVVVAEDDTGVFALLEERRANLAAQRVRPVKQLHPVSET